MLEEGFMKEGYVRRLPVYLLLDCSASMQGEPINAVNEGLGLIYRLLMEDPQAVDSVYISVICFSSQANQYPLVALDQFQPPALYASGTTAMGEAFSLLVQSIEQDLVVNTATQRGDYRPLVFLLTDGAPTDSYSDAVQRLKALPGNRKPTLVALGCGQAVNTAMLHEVTDNVFTMNTISADAIKAFFKWISGSILQTSRSVGGRGNQSLTISPPTSIPGITYNP
jgi:uncharacterized protein YegL